MIDGGNISTRGTRGVRVRRAANRSTASSPAAATPQVVVKPYLYVQDLVDVTPWTEDAIKKLMQRGVLREGRHWFHFGRRIMFKWAAIVELIESGCADREERGHEDVIRIPMLNGGFARVPAKDPR